MKTQTFKTEAAYYAYLDNNETDYIRDSGYQSDIGWFVTYIENGLELMA